MMKRKPKNVKTITLLASLCCLFIVGCGGNKAKNQKDKKSMNVVTLDSGLQYEILKEAPREAKTPETGKTVVVHYTGWLQDENGQKGAKFDSSVDRGQKFEFTLGVGHVIRGWDEGVALMKVGEKRLLTIPSKLGYGERGAGGVIPPNATLIFEVELFDVKG